MMVEVRTANQLEDLKKLLTSGGDISIAVGYVDMFALRIIEEHIEGTQNSDQKFRMLVNLKEDAVHPKVVNKLVQLAEVYKTRFQCREYYIQGRGILHSKLYLAHENGKAVVFLTGSHNLTRNALECNVEHSVKIELANNDNLAGKVLDEFNGLWDDESCASTITGGRAIEYGEIYFKNKKARAELTLLPHPQNLEQHFPPQADCWLFKCNIVEPYDEARNQYSFTDLLNTEYQIDTWGEGTNSSSAKKYLRDNIKLGDHVFFYHCGMRRSSEVVGIAMVVRGPYPFPPNPEKTVVEIQAVRKLENPVTLVNIKAHPTLKASKLATVPQLTVVPILPNEWEEILAISERKSFPS